MLRRTALVPKKTRKCTVCRSPFERVRMTQKVCGSVECAAEQGRRDSAKQQRKAAREQRKVDQAKREELMTRPEWVAKLQQVFNAYIRERDRFTTCICCGKPFEPQKFGGSMDAGHYLSRSQAPHLRFVETNVFGQRKNCNMPGGTTREKFRAGVIARIGLAAVEALEADHEPRKYTIDDLKKLVAVYKEKLRVLRVQHRELPESA